MIVDCVNTATGLSYQDVFDGATKVREWISDKGIDNKSVEDVEALLLSQSAPQIIRHVRFLHRATTEYATKVYLKVGTTGTGGMGLNIPYTHSEDKPSKVLLAKNEAAFGHTGLLFLLARTPNAPIVKEVKPAAMIGYRGVEVRPARDKHGNDDLFEPKRIEVSEASTLNLSEPIKSYKKQGKLEVPIVDTGENGVFTAGEFVAITAMGQMEYITPEEIAQVVVHEIRGANTGQDIISALDGSVLEPPLEAAAEVEDRVTRDERRLEDGLVVERADGQARGRGAAREPAPRLAQGPEPSRTPDARRRDLESVAHFPPTLPPPVPDAGRPAVAHGPDRY